MTFEKRLASYGIIPTLSISSASDALAIAEILHQAALPVIEVMFRNPAAAEALATITKKYPKMDVGAGTILTLEQAQTAVDAGAKFIVSPSFNKETVDWCRKRSIPVITGCSTPTEIQQALLSGVTTVKFFPAEPSGGIEAIKLLKGAFSSVHFIATGGVDFSNFKNYLSAKELLAVGGGFMFNKDAIKNKNWAGVALSLDETLSQLFNFRIAHVGLSCKTEDDGTKAAQELASVFGLSHKTGGKSDFAGTLFECMKKPYYGINGHIAVGTDDAFRAYEWLSRKGIEFYNESLSYTADGLLNVAFMKKEYCGYALHLLQNPKGY